MSHSKEDLVKYRIQKARNIFRDAQILIHEKSWDSAANRLYYSCFYAAIAYLAQKEIEVRTHNGVKAKFNQLLVKSGKITVDEGFIFNNLFELRQDADYEDFQNIESNDILPMVQEISKLIDKIESIIYEEGHD